MATTHCHAEETSLGIYDICDVVHFPLKVAISEIDMLRNNTQIGCVV